jgi:NADH:ubiquinone oxidoreductase subunit 4 (subunit M)
VFVISILGIVYASLTTIQQIDLKKIIAYSSVGHMAVVMIGMFACNTQGLLGSVLLMISHGVVSSALFLMIGALYERHHTRIIRYFSGLLVTMPLFASLFCLFTFANIGLPGTSSFVCEFLIITGSFFMNSWVGLFCSSGMVLSACYGL